MFKIWLVLIFIGSLVMIGCEGKVCQDYSSNIKAITLPDGTRVECNR